MAALGNAIVIADNISFCDGKKIANQFFQKSIFEARNVHIKKLK